VPYVFKPLGTAGDIYGKIALGIIDVAFDSASAGCAMAEPSA
jgi:hypothetical protein